MVKIILDAGSCHMGNLRQALKMVQIAAELGADAIKFQLFKNLPPNIELPYEWMDDLTSHGIHHKIEVFASVWDRDGMIALVKNSCKSIKFAYSERNRELIKEVDDYDFENLYISGDIWTDFPVGTTKLYCIPEYPVKYFITFAGLFPLFNGFSDHTMGHGQTLNAIEAGAKIIEKHFKIENCACPDSRFALNPKEVEEMIFMIRGMK